MKRSCALYSVEHTNSCIIGCCFRVHTLGIMSWIPEDYLQPDMGFKYE